MCASLRSLCLPTCFPHSAVLGLATPMGLECPGVPEGKIDLWGGEQAAAWVRGSAPTAEWVRIVCVTGQVT